MLSLILLLHWLLWLSSCWSLRGVPKNTTFFGELELEIFSTDPVCFFGESYYLVVFLKRETLNSYSLYSLLFFWKGWWNYDRPCQDHIRELATFWHLRSRLNSRYGHLQIYWRSSESYPIAKCCSQPASVGQASSFHLESSDFALISAISVRWFFAFHHPSTCFVFVATNKYPQNNTTRSGPKNIGQKTLWNPAKKGTTDHCPKTAGCVWRSLFGSSLWGPIVSRTMRLGSKKFPGKHHPGDIWMGTFFGGRNSHIYG